ncbi:MAG TPA: hypothetical protein VLB73_01740 [Patescibacteria group bacterium]|nr:hypothetical protein [Patescibacteria group bacterium]
MIKQLPRIGDPREVARRNAAKGTAAELPAVSAAREEQAELHRGPQRSQQPEKGKESR